MRLRFGLPLVACLAACLKGPTTSAGANDVRFDLSAQVTGGSSLGITVAYLDQGNVAVTLVNQSVSVTGGSQSVPLTIDLTQCLGDPKHLSNGSTCDLLVTIVLKQGGTVVDSTTVGPVFVTPGQVVQASASVAGVGKIDVYPTSLSLTPGAIGILRDTVFGANGVILTNAAVTWTSADTTIARVNDSGAVTGVASGTTHVTASAGGDSASATVVVSTPGGVALVISEGAFVQFSAPIGATIPSNALFTVSSAVDTTVVSGLTATITYNSGPSTGWLVAYVSDSSLGSRVVKRPRPTLHAAAASNVTTPATLDVVPNTTNLAAGTYTATVTVSGTNATPVNVSVTYTISATANPLVLSPDTVTFEEYGGGTILPTAATITGSQTGLTVTGYTFYGLATNWLSSTLTGGTTFTINPSTTTLPLGTLQALVHVQDGNGDTASVFINNDVSATFTKVVAGGGFSCGLTTGSTAYCWGANSIGQLGIGSGGGPYAQPMPVDIPNAGLNGTPVMDITAGYATACAVMSNNTVYCWGYNVDGETGTGSFGDTLASPVAISGLSAAQVSAGGYSTCGIGAPTVAPYGGEVYCWGADNYGQLGLGFTGASQDTPNTNEQAFVSVSTGFEHACGVVDSDAPTVYCWGLNTSGQIGIDSTGADYTTPKFVGSFVSVSAAGYHTCALNVDGSPSCWGENTYGELGIGAVGGNQLAPSAVTGVGPLAQIAAGYLHTCGVTTGGTAYCWGYDSAGALGNGQTTGSFGTPVAVTGGLLFASIAPSVAGYHTCGLTTAAAGVVYCWGYNAYGQLGNASTQNSGAPVQVVGQPATAGLSPGGGARVVKRPPAVKTKAKATARRPART